jgi:predicted DCC family thiol-disulfide oxidoreductase YuxK
MKALRQGLHDFWFAEAPPTRLALLRILIGGFALWYFGTEEDDLMRVANTDPRLFAPVGVVFGGPISLELFHWIYRATMVAALCFALGLWFRVTGPIFAGLQLWMLCYRNSWSMIYHSDNLLVLHAVVLGFARSADALSVDAFHRSFRQRGWPAADWRYGWPVRLICAVTVSAYFVTAMCKLCGPLGLSWMTGQALRSQMAVDQLRKELLGVDPNPISYTLYDWVPLFTVLAMGSMALEFFAPLALFNRRIGYVWAVNTFLMHWGILLVMHITFRYQLSGVVFASFFPLERVLSVPGRARDLWLSWRHRAATVPVARGPDRGAQASPRPSLPHATLFYDGECGLCNGFVQFVLRHDPAEYFQFATLQSSLGRAQLSRLGLSETELETMVLVELDHCSDRSSAALRVCRRLTGLWPALYALMLVPKPWRDWAYALVARNRKRWLKSPAACPVMTPEIRRRFIG